MRAHLRQLGSESLVYGLAVVAQRFVGVLLVPVYTRVFTPAEYGLVGVVTSVMVAATIFVVLALDTAAHRWFWETEDPADRKTTMASWAWCQLATSTLFAAGLTLGAGWLSGLLVGSAAAAPLLRVVAWTLPLGGLGMVLTNWLRLQRRAWATAAFATVFMLSTVAGSILLVVVMHRGVRGAFEGQLAAAAAGALLALAIMRDWLHPRHVRLTRLREMLRYALPLIPAGVAFWVVGMLDRLWVQRYASTAEVGLYQVGALVAASVAMGTNAFQQAWGPFALSIHRREESRQVYALVLQVYLWGASLLAAGVSLFTPEILRLFTTPAYAGAATVVPLLAFSFVLAGASYVAGVGPQIAWQTSPVAAAVTLAAGLNVLLNLLVTPHLGKEGAALANLASQALMALYLFRRAQQVYPIPYAFGPAMGILAFAGAAVAAGATLPGVGTWAAVGVKVLLLLLWIPALVVFRIARPAQLARVLRRARPRVAQPANGDA